MSGVVGAGLQNVNVLAAESLPTPDEVRRELPLTVVNSDVILNRMTVENGRLVLPDGMSYALLVLPDQGDMDLEVLRKLESLVKGGATVLGPRPGRTGSLEDYPNRDGEIAELAGRIWGDCDGGAVKEHAYGKGRVVWNRPVAEVLDRAGVGPDFVCQSGDGRARFDYLHRRADEQEIYLVSNMNERWEDVECAFGVTGKQPEIWHRGRLLGGNLTVLTALVGSAYLPAFDGAILFLEDVNEEIYRVTGC